MMGNTPSDMGNTTGDTGRLPDTMGSTSGDMGRLSGATGNATGDAGRLPDYVGKTTTVIFKGRFRIRNGRRKNAQNGIAKQKQCQSILRRIL